MRIEELMSKSVQWCGPDDTLDRAAQLMWDHDCGSLPVCTSNGTTTLVGIITDRDICMCSLFQGRPLHEIRVSEGMTKDLRVCRPEESAAEVEQTMRSAQIRRLPVVSRGGELIGVVSLADIAMEAARELSTSAQDITETEVGDTLAAICRPTRQSSAA